MYYVHTYIYFILLCISVSVIYPRDNPWRLYDAWVPLHLSVVIRGSAGANIAAGARNHDQLGGGRQEKDALDISVPLLACCCRSLKRNIFFISSLSQKNVTVKRSLALRARITLSLSHVVPLTFLNTSTLCWSLLRVIRAVSSIL